MPLNNGIKLGEEEDTPLADVVGVYRNMHPEDRERILISIGRSEKETGSTFREKCESTVPARRMNGTGYV